MKTSLSRWVATNGPFRNASLTFIGMLLCIFASVIGLVAATSDQTGYSAAAVTEEFRRDLGLPQRSEASVAGRGPSTILEFASVRREVRQTNDGKHRQLEEEEELFSLEDDASTSDRRARDFHDDELADGFRHFVREVDRLGTVSNVRRTESTATVDVLNSPTSPGVRLEQLASLISEVHRFALGTQGRSSIEYRITLWSATPSVEAVSITTEQASDLETAISRRLDNGRFSNVRVSVECACWMLPNSQRPDFSVQVVHRQDE